MKPIDPQNLICPDCGSSLSYKDRYICSKCDNQYQIINGVHILLPSKLNESKKRENEYWLKSDVDGLKAPAWRALIHKGNDIIFFHHEIIPKYSFHGKVLEIGAGICWASALIKSHFNCEIYASDVSINALTKGIEVSRLMGTNIDYFVALDCENIPFADNFFDCILGIAILHHLSDPMRALKEIRRVLKPGAFYLGIGEEMADSFLKPVYRRICKVEERARELGIIEATYSYSEWNKMLESTQFRSYHISLYKDDKYRFSFLRKAYYKIAKHIPDIFLKNVLSSIHIYVEK